MGSTETLRPSENTFFKHCPESSLRTTDKLAKFASSVIEQETEVILWQ